MLGFRCSMCSSSFWLTEMVLGLRQMASTESTNSFSLSSSISKKSKEEKRKEEWKKERERKEEIYRPISLMDIEKWEVLNKILTKWIQEHIKSVIYYH